MTITSTTILTITLLLVKNYDYCCYYCLFNFITFIIKVTITAVNTTTFTTAVTTTTVTVFYYYYYYCNYYCYTSQYY